MDTGNDGGEDEYLVEGGDDVVSVSIDAREDERLFVVGGSSVAWERLFLCLSRGGGSAQRYVGKDGDLLKICNMDWK